MNEFSEMSVSVILEDPEGMTGGRPILVASELSGCGIVARMKVPWRLWGGRLGAEAAIQSPNQAPVNSGREDSHQTEI
jgi:hypothetical protein